MISIPLSKLYVITNGNGEIIDPNANAFLNKTIANKYKKHHWAGSEISAMTITVEKLSEFLGIE
jgi:hypothetical protein